MNCLNTYLDLCIIKASGNVDASYFGFAEFIGAFALLAIVFTIADVQYRFRISVSPLPLPKITFWAIGVIGFGTLATDLWVAQEWLVVYVPYMTYSAIQGLFASCFLITAMAWLYFAFLKPPIFSKWNAKKYGKVLFNYLLKGSDSELPIIAAEVSRSADKFIETFSKHQADFQEQFRKHERGEKIQPNSGNYASDIMKMIGNRKFCRHVIAASPGTAIRLFQAAANKKIYDAPLGQFAKNISIEAILNPDSNLYHEDSYYQSGLFGEIKPFTQAIYGSYRLVEGLGSNFGSPLDIDFELINVWTAPQLEAYSRAVLATYADRMTQEEWHKHSYSLTRALQNFKQACKDVYKLNGLDNQDQEIYERLRVCVHFVDDLINLLEKYENKVIIKRWKPNKKPIDGDIYDQVAYLMSEIIFNASGITEPYWPCWNIQHNTVWTTFFDGFSDSKARRIIEFKLRRLIYDEITEFDKYTDLKSFKAARYLGICLNCMGVKLEGKQRLNSSTLALQKVVLRWVKKNYPSLYEDHPVVADACLMGSISYNAEKRELKRTGLSIRGREPYQEVLALLE